MVPIGREQSGITLIHQKKKKVEVLLQLLLSGIIKADVCVAQNSGNLVICKRAFHEELPLVNIIYMQYTHMHTLPVFWGNVNKIQYKNEDLLLVYRSLFL